MLIVVSVTDLDASVGGMAPSQTLVVAVSRTWAAALEAAAALAATAAITLALPRPVSFSAIPPESSKAFTCRIDRTCCRATELKAKQG